MFTLIHISELRALSEFLNARQIQYEKCVGSAPDGGQLSLW